MELDAMFYQRMRNIPQINFNDTKAMPLRRIYRSKGYHIQTERFTAWLMHAYHIEKNGDTYEK